MADRTGAAASTLAERPGVYFVARTSGPVDGVVQVRAADDQALMAGIDHIRRVPGVRKVRPFRVLTILRERPSVAGPVPDVTLDDLDWRLLAELQRDARTSYVQLGRIIGLSQAATRARVVHLHLACRLCCGASPHQPRVRGGPPKPVKQFARSGLAGVAAEGRAVEYKYSCQTVRRTAWLQHESY